MARKRAAKRFDALRAQADRRARPDDRLIESAAGAGAETPDNPSCPEYEVTAVRVAAT